MAFDFVGRFELADHYCGYIIVYQPPEGGAFGVTRIEENYFPKSVFSTWNGVGQSPEELWTQLASTHCPGWQPSWTIAPPT